MFKYRPLGCFEMRWDEMRWSCFLSCASLILGVKGPCLNWPSQLCRTSRQLLLVVESLKSHTAQRPSSCVSVHQKSIVWTQWKRCMKKATMCLKSSTGWRASTHTPIRVLFKSGVFCSVCCQHVHHSSPSQFLGYFMIPQLYNSSPVFFFVTVKLVNASALQVSSRSWGQPTFWTGYSAHRV